MYNLPIDFLVFSCYNKGANKERQVRSNGKITPNLQKEANEIAERPESVEKHGGVTHNIDWRKNEILLTVVFRVWGRQSLKKPNSSLCDRKARKTGCVSIENSEERKSVLSLR